MGKNKNPFKKDVADSSESAAQETVQAEAPAQEPVQGSAAQEPAQAEESVAGAEKPEDKPEKTADAKGSAVIVPVDVPLVEQTIEKPKSKEEVLAFVKEQFKNGKPVFVIALERGEHPRGVWNKEGSKFRLQNVEAYSHRWMKLA